jgi:hypothetical protein
VQLHFTRETFKAIAFLQHKKCNCNLAAQNIQNDDALPAAVARYTATKRKETGTTEPSSPVFFLQTPTTSDL